MMQLVENVIFENYVRYKQILQAMEQEAALLPKGNLTYRTAKGHQYCYLQHWVGAGVVQNRRILNSEIAKTEQQLARRADLLKNIKILKKHIEIIEKEFLFFPSNVLPDAFKKQATAADSQKPYATLKGDFVRSKSEVIIANELYIANIPYTYEKPLWLEGYDHPFYPDFTIYTLREGKTVYWEHCGLIQEDGYRSSWNRKKAVYEKSGISEWAKTLIVTYETYDSPLSVTDIRRHIAMLQQL